MTARQPRPARRYFVLVLHDAEFNRWGVEFGDYDRECVQSELDDYRDKGVAKRFLRILTTLDRQADIDAAVAKLNAAL